MKRAARWLVSATIALSAIGATAIPASAHTGDVWSNSDGFSYACIGITNTYPSQMYSQARTQMGLLGYSPVGGALGSSFTRANFLNADFYDYGVYAHTHGDNYWAASGAPAIDSAILQDPGTTRCNSSSKDMIRSSSIKSATMGTPYNLVIMSTCMLGSSNSTMPGAFQIEKVKNSSQREFYLGFAKTTWDSSAMRFERAFFTYLNADHNRTAYQAFAYAQGIGGYEAVNSANPFTPNWWGNPNYNGVAG